MVPCSEPTFKPSLQSSQSYTHPTNNSTFQPSSKPSQQPTNVPSNLPTLEIFINAKNSIDVATVSAVSASGFVAITGSLYYFVSKSSCLGQIMPGDFHVV